MFRKNDELPAMPLRIDDVRIFEEEASEFLPLLVRTRPTYFQRQRFQLLQRLNLGFQLRDRFRRCSLVDYSLLRFLQFLAGGIVQIVDVLELVFRRGRCEFGSGFGTPFHKTLFAEPAFEAFAPAAERLVDRFWGRREASLQNCERKPNRSLLPAVLE